MKHLTLTKEDGGYAWVG